MGISGHILGEKGLRRLNRMIPGYDFDRAYNRNGVGEARMIDERGECLHFDVDFKAWEARMVAFPTHWASCPSRESETTASAKLTVDTPHLRVWENQDGSVTEQRAEMYEMQVVAPRADANVELGLRQRFAEAIAQISDEPPTFVQFSGGVKPVPFCDQLGEFEDWVYIFSISGIYWPRRRA